MEYLHVLSRPKVIDQEHDVVWTEAYIDSTVSPGAPGGAGVPLPWESSPVFAPGHGHCISVLGIGVLTFSCAGVCAGPPGNGGVVEMEPASWRVSDQHRDTLLIVSSLVTFLSCHVLHKCCPCSCD